MTQAKNSEFLAKLQQEASLQSQLYSNPLLPKQLDRFTTLISNYPWQSILVCSGILALCIEIFRYEIF